MANDDPLDRQDASADAHLDPAQLAMLKQGVAGRNAWREEHHKIRAKLQGADLSWRTSAGRASAGR